MGRTLWIEILGVQIYGGGGIKILDLSKRLEYQKSSQPWHLRMGIESYQFVLKRSIVILCPY